MFTIGYIIAQHHTKQSFTKITIPFEINSMSVWWPIWYFTSERKKALALSFDIVKRRDVISHVKKDARIKSENIYHSILSLEKRHFGYQFSSCLKSIEYDYRNKSTIYSSNMNTFERDNTEQIPGIPDIPISLSRYFQYGELSITQMRFTSNRQIDSTEKLVINIWCVKGGTTYISASQSPSRHEHAHKIIVSIRPSSERFENTVINIACKRDLRRLRFHPRIAPRKSVLYRAVKSFASLTVSPEEQIAGEPSWPTWLEKLCWSV